MCRSSSNGSDVAKSLLSTTSTKDIACDLVGVRTENFMKMITKEDGHFFHIHKIIGMLVLTHYIYRFYMVLTTGSMQFDSSLFTPYCILLHMLLSGSSFIFRISEKRIQSAPMIYPEFRLHSIIFAYRSLIVMLLMWASVYFEVPFLLYLRGPVVLVTMVLADVVTNAYKDQGRHE